MKVHTWRYQRQLARAEINKARELVKDDNRWRVSYWDADTRKWLLTDNVQAEANKYLFRAVVQHPGCVNWKSFNKVAKRCCWPLRL